MPRILSVSSSRADVGILLPVWRSLSAQSGCELHVMLTGAHAASGVPDMIPGAVVHRGGADLGGADPSNASAAMAEISKFAGETFGKVEPDLIFLIGDRLDMLPAATAALPFNIPLAHLHGGEITEGAIDDRIRHALTKLSHLHFVSSAGARARLLALGEESWRIHVTGAPGLDTLLAAPILSRPDFLKQIGFPADTAALSLVTVHPETNASDAEASLHAVFDAIRSRPGPVLFTAPNSDPGGAAMRTAIERFAGERPETRFVDTLGPILYPNALRHAAVMIGNSSSGVIEAGLFGLPVIDVGDRQSGRERGKNVVHVANSSAAISAALDKMGQGGRFAEASPYGDGHAAPRIAAVLAELPPRSALLRKVLPAAPVDAT